MNGLVKRALRSALGAPGNWLLSGSTQFLPKVNRALRRDVSIASRFIPHDPTQRFMTIPLDGGRREGDALPVPPPELWLGYGRSTGHYLTSGRRDAESLARLIADSGKPLAACRRILELGCGAGRMLRFLRDAGAHQAELWGADVSADHVLWCQQHLSPPFRFVTTTSCPHLPFPDGHFDLVYAGSVFTHVSELVDAWLLEIRRVLAPGGRAYLTVLDRHSLAYLRAHPARRLAQRVAALPPDMQFWTSDFGMTSLGRGFGAVVFYDERFIRERWGRILDVLSITPEAYDLQTAVVLGKSAA
jgi:SAM-dependent methyltransferase